MRLNVGICKKTALFDVSPYFSYELFSFADDESENETVLTPFVNN